MRIIDEIREDHRLIDQVAGSLFLLGRSGIRPPGRRSRISRSGSISPGLSPRVPSPREELLFRALVEHGEVPGDHGPLAILKAEHAAALVEIDRIEAAGPCPESEALARRLAAEIWQHLDKEETVLFPEAERRLIDGGIRQLDGPPPRPRWRRLAPWACDLIRRLPPMDDPDLIRGDGCIPCAAFGDTCHGIETEWWSDWENRAPPVSGRGLRPRCAAIGAVRLVLAVSIHRCSTGVLAWRSGRSRAPVSGRHFENQAVSTDGNTVTAVGRERFLHSDAQRPRRWRSVDLGRSHGGSLGGSHGRGGRSGLGFGNGGRALWPDRDRREPFRLRSPRRVNPCRQWSISMLRSRWRTNPGRRPSSNGSRGCVSASQMEWSRAPPTSMATPGSPPRVGGPSANPGSHYPGLPNLPVWDGNPEVFEIDPDALGARASRSRSGQPVFGRGVLAFVFGSYQLWPTSLDLISTPQLPIPASAGHSRRPDHRQSESRTPRSAERRRSALRPAARQALASDS